MCLVILSAPRSLLVILMQRDLSGPSFTNLIEAPLGHLSSDQFLSDADLLLKLSLKISLEFSLANAQVLTATRAAIAIGRKMFFMIVCCVKYLIFVKIQGVILQVAKLIKILQ
jgi:hypothetical protein